MKVEDYIASGVLEQYVLGELSAADEEEVLGYAERYPEVRREIALIEESLEKIARSLAIEPPAYILDQIQDKLSEKDEVKDFQADKNKKINFLRYGVAATFTLKLMFMAVAAHFWINWQHSENKLGQMQERYDRLEQETRQLSQAFAIVNDPSYQAIALESSDAKAEIYPIVYWNESDRVYVNPQQLPANDEAHEYQLWSLVDGKPKSLGIFDVSSDANTQMIRMEGLENISSFIITLEPKGGSNKPNLEDQHYRGEIL